MRRLRYMQIASDAVERGKDLLPVAFRIWRAGPNETSDGIDIFDESSAKALSLQQDSVGRQFSFDYNHNMFTGNGDPELARAAGFHSIEVRYPDGSIGFNESKDDPELWAVNCVWTAEARGYLEQDPPLYRYFSPAFECDKGGVVTKYLNCALTNIPATYGIPSLRSEKENEMTIEKLLAIMGVSPDQLDGLDEPGIKDLLASKFAAMTADSPLMMSATDAEPEAEKLAAVDPLQTQAESDPEAEKMAALIRAARAYSGQASSSVQAVRSAPVTRSAAPRNAAPVRAQVTGFEPTRDVKFRSAFNLPSDPLKDVPPHFQIVKHGDQTEYVFLRNEGDRVRNQERQDAYDRVARRFGGAL